jgi:hypothetical protein
VLVVLCTEKNARIEYRSEVWGRRKTEAQIEEVDAAARMW